MYVSSTVYFSKTINGNALDKLFLCANKDKIVNGRIGVKIHSGEMGGQYYVCPTLIQSLVNSLNATIVDGNTPYIGSRSSNESHWKTFEQHGFTSIAKCDLLDEEDDVELTFNKGEIIQKHFVGSHLLNYDSLVIITHFKGHKTCGFGGAIKDYSIGLASLKGKCWIHTAGKNMMGIEPHANQNDFIVAMIDAIQMVKLLEQKVIFINVMNNLSVDGDGCPNPRPPEIGDIGILVSTDPVAVDKACLDLLYSVSSEKNIHLIKQIEEKQGLDLIKYANRKGIGNINYKLVDINQAHK